MWDGVGGSRPAEASKGLGDIAGGGGVVSNPCGRAWERGEGGVVNGRGGGTNPERHRG